MAVNTNVEERLALALASRDMAHELVTRINAGGGGGGSSDGASGAIQTSDGSGGFVGVTSVAVAHGGTGATTAAGARTALGLAVGTNVQAWDTDLDVIAGLADPNADRILFWDDSAGAYTYLTAGSGLTITGTTLTAAGSAYTADEVTLHLASTVFSISTTPFALQSHRPTNAQTGTTYTLVLTDEDKLVTLSNASAVTVTVPPNSSVAFDVGAEIDLAQLGAGQVTIAAGAGVTINSWNGGLTLAGQYTGVCLKKTATNTWLLIGGLGITASTGWSVTGGYTSDKAFNPESTTLTEVARVLGSLIDALKALGFLSS